MNEVDVSWIAVWYHSDYLSPNQISMRLREIAWGVAPLSGLIFLALLIASFVVANGPPDSSSSGPAVAAFWREHAGAQVAASILGGLAAVFLVWFGDVVAATIRNSEGEPARLASTAFGGFLLTAAGGLAIAGFQFTAARTAGDVPATVTQTLAALNQDFFFLLDGGVVVAVLATAAATLAHRVLPRWFGYLSLAVGALFLTPVFAVAFPLFGLWTIALSLLLARAAEAG